jgi:predicted regulator of Ras-like GTPase activity (Roadblock/LC7/MglB family)
MTAYGTSELQETINRLELAAYVDKPFTMAQIRDVVRGVVERASREDPYRSGKRKVSDAFSKALVDLQTNTNARCVMLISSGGYPVDTAGHTEGLDLVSIAALTAGNFMASAELAKLLGTGSVFKSSYQEGPEYNIYSYDVNGDLLIAVIFGAESRPGVVWLYTKRTAAELAELAEEEGEMTQASIEELSDSLDSQIDDIWNG